MEKEVGIFRSIYIEHLERKKSQKSPQHILIVKSLTLNVARKVTMINIYLQQNIKIEHLERKKSPKSPNTHANVEKGLGIFFFIQYKDNNGYIFNAKKCQTILL